MSSTRRIFAAMLLFGWGFAAAAVEDTSINLLQEERFLPVRWLGMESAARDWMLNNDARNQLTRRDSTYVSGTECFKLSFDADGMTLRFLDPLAPAGG